MYADKYDTTVELIELVNYELSIPIRDGIVVVIPPGMKQPLDLPPFAAHEVVPPGLGVELLASKLAVSQEALARYNDLGRDCQTIVGWVLVPHADGATP